MINFTRISDSSVLGRILRLPLRILPKNTTVRIVQGPLRGKRWIAGSCVHGCWLGSYEAEKQRKLAAFVRPGMVCWDIGANVGFYTMLLAELVGPGGKVYTFEPLPRNVDLLGRHVTMNGYQNVVILPCALGGFDGEAHFDPGPNASMGRMAAEGQLVVPCSKADTLLAAGKVEVPDVVKIDVEGAEADVLSGARLVMDQHPTLLLATHGDSSRRHCIELLTALGYEVRALNDRPLCDTDEIIATVGR
jgi:FkbM family methyltransferase